MQERGWLWLFLAWLVAMLATLGALFLGEVMGHTPCVLCWYQRICMFPLALMLGLALAPWQPQVVRFALPLALLGLAVSVYQLLLIHGVIPERMVPCQQGVPCGVVQVRWFGFVTIPLLSALAFATIAALLAALRGVISRK